jgi:hypothetical protein
MHRNLLIVFAACYEGQIAWSSMTSNATKEQVMLPPKYLPVRDSSRYSNQKGAAAMTIHVSLAPLVSLIAGILILVMPRLLNFIVAIYLIVIGLIGLFGMGNTHF